MQFLHYVSCSLATIKQYIENSLTTRCLSLAPLSESQLFVIREKYSLRLSPTC